MSLFYLPDVYIYIYIVMYKCTRPSGTNVICYVCLRALFWFFEAPNFWHARCGECWLTEKFYDDRVLIVAHVEHGAWDEQRWERCRTRPPAHTRVVVHHVVKNYESFRTLRVYAPSPFMRGPMMEVLWLWFHLLVMICIWWTCTLWLNYKTLSKYIKPLHVTWPTSCHRKLVHISWIIRNPMCAHIRTHKLN